MYHIKGFVQVDLSYSMKPSNALQNGFLLFSGQRITS